jgi:DNA-binding CsgD family transcriptional regulator
MSSPICSNPLPAGTGARPQSTAPANHQRCRATSRPPRGPPLRRPCPSIDAVRAAATAAVGADKATAAGEGSRLLLREAAAFALGRPPGRKIAAPGGLSRRELEVAGLVASGLTNAQVAHQLHLSPRTVENHVAHAPAKLGARNRTELAARLADRSVSG